VTDRRDTIDRSEPQVDGAARRHLGPTARRVSLRRGLRSAVADAATIGTLRTDLQELAATLHEVAASIHDLGRDEHVQAFLDGVGDPVLHRQEAEGHAAAAAAERASAEKERRAARQDHSRP
jgi:hypothetical protein